MDESMHTRVISICVVFVIIMTIAAALADNRSDSGSGQASESQTESTSEPAASQADTETGPREQASLNSGNAAGHNGHNGCMSTPGNDLSRYLTGQNSIMMSMTEDMVIREKSGSASLGFLQGMIPYHETAIKMSGSYPNYQGRSDELRAIAQDIVTAQKDKLKWMNELIKSYEKDGRKDQIKKDAYLGQYGKVFTGDSMSRHVDTLGAGSLGQAFVEGMIMYHQMTVDITRDILEYTDCEEIRTMAQNTIDVWEEEIARMEKIVKEQQESQQE